MAELLQENWLLVVAALLALALAAWWILVASRKTRVEIEFREGDGAPARRNQALIDAPPAATVDAEIPPPTPQGLAGAGEAVAAMATPVPIDLPDDEARALLTAFNFPFRQ